MAPSPFIVLLDANALFPFSLRDTLLRAAAAGFYQVRWSSQILDEMTRNLVAKGTMPEDKANRLRAIMTREFPEAPDSPTPPRTFAELAQATAVKRSSFAALGLSKLLI